MVRLTKSRTSDILWPSLTNAMDTKPDLDAITRYARVCSIASPQNVPGIVPPILTSGSEENILIPWFVVVFPLFLGSQFDFYPHPLKIWLILRRLIFGFSDYTVRTAPVPQSQQVSWWSCLQNLHWTRSTSSKSITKAMYLAFWILVIWGGGKSGSSLAHVGDKLSLWMNLFSTIVASWCITTGWESVSNHSSTLIL